MNNKKDQNNSINISIQNNNGYYNNDNLLYSFQNQSEPDTESLGILNVDEVKDFTEEQNPMEMDSFTVSEKLKKERQLALAILNKNRNKSSQPPQRLKPNNNNGNNLSCLFGQDKTNFMNYRDPKENTFDISELALSKTIEAKTPIRYSFEPSEISGRSTLQCERSKINSKNIFASPTVEEILATSCSEEIRNIYGKSGRESVPSLPRTADLSNTSNDKSYWDQLNGDFDNEFIVNDENQSQTSFRPAEEVYAKLIADELKWQEEFAIIPETDKNFNENRKSNNNTKDVQLQKITQKPIGHFQERINLTDFSGFFGSGNISVQSNNKTNSEQMSISSYFNKNSDDIKMMIPNKSPIKNMRPTALIDSSCSGEDTETDSSNVLTPTNDHNNDKPKFSTEIKNVAKSLMKMDGADTSKAINDFIKTHDKIIQDKHKKPLVDPLTDITEKFYAMELGNKINNDKNILYTKFADYLKTPIIPNNNKDEKILKSAIVTPMSDTASFTESLLDSSIFQSKSPSTSVRSNDVSSVGVNTKTYNLTSVTNSQNSSLDERNLKTPENTNKLIVQGRHSKKRSISSSGINLSKSPRGTEQIRDDILSSDSIPSKDKTSLNFEPISPKQPREYINKNNYKENCIPGVLKATQSSPLIQNDLNNFTNDDTFSQLFASSASLKSPIATGKLSLPIYGTRSKSQSPRNNNLLTSNMRTNSQCSTASSEYSRSGLLPIKSTHGELSWGSVKLRKNVEKSIQIKNISPKRLSLRLQITGPGFQLSGSEKNGILILQGLECRSISFVFCPTVIGPAVGQLILQPSIETSTAKRTIRLYGYGGHTNVSLEGIQKGPIGSAFLPLGDIKQLTRSIEKSFVLTNKGTLSAFASIEFQTKGKDIAYMNPSVFVTPQKVIIPPQNSVKIKIKFKPCRDELKKLIKKNSDVVIISNLLIVTGDEPCRHRIRKLVKDEKTNNKANISQLNSLCTQFYHENPTDIIHLKECANVINELLSTFRTQDLALTINRNMDDTIVDFGLDSEEESILFHSIASETQIQSDSDDNIPSDILQSNHRASGESWSVKPKFLEFTPYSRDVKILKIKSNFYTTQLFELNSNIRHFFAFTPREGEIKSGNEKEIQIKMTSTTFPSEPIIITIFIENESITVPVYLKHENYMPPHRQH